MSYAYGICSDTSLERRQAVPHDHMSEASIMWYLEAGCRWNWDFAPWNDSQERAYNTVPWTRALSSRDRERNFLAANPVCLRHGAPPVALRERHDSRLRLHRQVFANFLTVPNRLDSMRRTGTGLHQLWRAS